jgi:hypothetical protein
MSIIKKYYDKKWTLQFLVALYIWGGFGMHLNEMRKILIQISKYSKLLFRM